VTLPHVGMSRWEGGEAETSAGIHLGMAEAETSAGPSPSPGQARRLLAVALWEGAEAAGGFPAPGPSPASASSAPALHANAVASGADGRNDGEGDGVAAGSMRPWAIQPSDAGGGPGPAAAGLAVAAAPVGVPPVRDDRPGSGGAEADAGGGDAEAEDVSSSQWGRLLSAIQVREAAGARAEFEERLESLRQEERLHPEPLRTLVASTGSSGQLEPDSAPGPLEPECISGAGGPRDAELHAADHAEPSAEPRLTADVEDRGRLAPADHGGRQATTDPGSARSEAGASTFSDALRHEQKPVRQLHFAVSGPAVSQRGEVLSEDLPSGRHSASSSSTPTGRSTGNRNNTGAAGTPVSAAGSSPTAGDIGTALGFSPGARDVRNNAGDRSGRCFPRLLGDADAVDDFEEESSADEEDEVMLPTEVQNDADADDDLQEMSLNSEELQLAATTLVTGPSEESLEGKGHKEDAQESVAEPAASRSDDEVAMATRQSSTTKQAVRFPEASTNVEGAATRPSRIHAAASSSASGISRGVEDTTLTSFALDESGEDPLANLGFGESDEDSDASVEEEDFEEVTAVAPLRRSPASTGRTPLLAGGDEASSEDEIEDFRPASDLHVGRVAAPQRLTVPPSAHQVTTLQEADISSDEEVEQLESAAAARARGNVGTGRTPPVSRLPELQLASAHRSNTLVQSARGTLDSARSATSVLEVERREISDDDSEADADESVESD